MFSPVLDWLPSRLQNFVIRLSGRNSDLKLTIERVRRLSNELRQLTDHALGQWAKELRSAVDPNATRWPRSDSQGPCERVELLARLSMKRHTKWDGARQAQSTLGEDLSIASAALASEAIRRICNVELYDTQFLGGLAMAQGRIVEMQTGEGKTLTAVVAAVQLGLLGYGVHVMTVNPYLAKRDFEQLQPIYNLCGLSCGLIQTKQSKPDKRQAYLCDVTYGPGYEFGFDYLRDLLLQSTSPAPLIGRSFRDRQKGVSQTPLETVQRPLAFAIIDEADSVLIDEASTPLVLSFCGGGVAPNAAVYCEAKRLADTWKMGEQYRKVQSSSGQQVLELTPRGIQELADWDWRAITCHLDRPIQEYVEQSLQAKEFFHRDVHYVVLENKIQLVDQQTGRILPDRTLRGGLHQAIEAKEGVVITHENATSARITRQRCFRSYDRICGMTGTATSTEMELKCVYALDVMVIPTHRPSLREQLPLRAFASMRLKEAAILESVRRIHALGRPILIGTANIESNTRIAEMLRSDGLDIQVLDGRQDEEEASIVSTAGQFGKITVATNVAGRGTDIGLGEGVQEIGGLHVIIAEPQASVRVDRQLAGRAARHGDPGSYQMFTSADDLLISKHDATLAQKIRSASGMDGEVVAADAIEQAILQLQKRNEELRVRERLWMSKQDDWLEQLSREWN